MGKYINQTSKGTVGSSAASKIKNLIDDGAIAITQPVHFIPNLVCVVDNGFFGAAAYAYTEGELKAFTDPSDRRPKKWFTWDKVEQYAS